MKNKSRATSHEPRAPTEYDIIIIGGGLVGASLACALAGSRARIAVVEAVPARAAQHPSYDDRGLALSVASKNILDSIKVWPDLSAQVCPIRCIHVSDRGHFGFVRLHARDINAEVLGYVVSARELGQALASVSAGHGNIELICPARTLEINAATDCISIKLDSGKQQVTLRCKLLVAADGARSETCRQLGIPMHSKDYGQTAIIANISTEKPHDHIAYERFTDSGPLALLPLPERRCKIVFTVRTGDADYYLDMAAAEFLETIQARFGRRLGRFTRVGARKSYPLMLHQAEQQIRERTVLLGNAAHTIHPNGAQGLNLCLRDVAALAAGLVPVLENGADPGDPVLLEKYLSDRLPDQRNIIRFTDGLASLFYDQQPLKVLARNSGMLMMDLFPVLKRKLLSCAMGINGKSTVMVR